MPLCLLSQQYFRHYRPGFPKGGKRHDRIDIPRLLSCPQDCPFRMKAHQGLGPGGGDRPQKPKALGQGGQFFRVYGKGQEGPRRVGGQHDHRQTGDGVPKRVSAVPQDGQGKGAPVSKKGKPNFLFFRRN